MTRIYMSSPDVGELEERYVVDALRSGWVAPLGPHVDAFELEVAERVGVKHSVALSSGTAALHLALVSWGIGPGDYIPLSTLTFAATANAVIYTGATPVFVDCDEITGNIDPNLLDDAIGTLRREGKKVPAIVPVDLLGRCADYSSITEIAARRDVKILSDAAESLGASHRGIAAGSWGDAAVLSFNGNKIMTTSGGGMLLTDDEKLADRVRFLSTQAREPAVHYEHHEIGYNYRLSNLLAALGRAQLERLDDMIANRRAIRDRYADLFANVDGVKVFQRDGDEHDNCWLTAILVDEEVAGWSARDLMDHLTKNEIESRPLWKSMHAQPVHAHRAHFTSGASDRLFEKGLTLPSGSALSAAQQSQVTTVIHNFVESV